MGCKIYPNDKLSEWLSKWGKADVLVCLDIMFESSLLWGNKKFSLPCLWLNILLKKHILNIYHTYLPFGPIKIGEQYFLI